MAARRGARYLRDMASPYGTLLKYWRGVRNMSQLDLATEAGVSARHLSFIESGRSQPSREMVLTLAEALDVPLRERNALLEAAGFAARYRASPLDSVALADVLRSLEAMLDRMEPFPCVVLDRLWVVRRANRAAMRLIATLVGPELAAPPINLMRLLFAPAMRDHIGNWDAIAPVFARQLHRQALAGDRDAGALLDSLPGVPAAWRTGDLVGELPTVVPLELAKDDLRLSLFTVIATLGTPLDVTLQELRIETYLPVDAASDATLRRLASHA